MWLTGFGLCTQRTPERREDAEGFSLPGGNLPGLEQQPGIEAFDGNSIRHQFRFQRLVPCHRIRLIAAVPCDRFGTGFPDKGGKNFIRSPPAQNQPAVRMPAQRLVQCRQGMMQPPARGSTPSPFAGCFVIQNVETHNGAPGLRREFKCGVIRQAQVLAEPDDDRLHPAITCRPGDWISAWRAGRIRRAENSW